MTIKGMWRSIFILILVLALPAIVAYLVISWSQEEKTKLSVKPTPAETLQKTQE